MLLYLNVTLAQYIGTGYSIVADRIFASAVTKIQRGEVQGLTN